MASGTGSWGSISWTYDAVGNRQTQIDGTGTSTYNYQSNSNRLTGISGSQSASYSLDANGNTTAESGNGYTYNQNQRLIHAAAGQSADYLYNAQGQRAIKTVGGQVTVYHYDQAGQLLAETGASGAVQADYLHLDGQPLAKIDATGTSYIHPDHLGTPQLMTDSQGTVVWQIQARPFGDSPAITGTQTLNLRFPGQYYDAESGLHQNWFRDYQPNLGRYVEADPIGLRGGALSLYVYVQNSPIDMFDLMGLIYEISEETRRKYASPGFIVPEQPYWTHDPNWKEKNKCAYGCFITFGAYSYIPGKIIEESALQIAASMTVQLTKKGGSKLIHVANIYLLAKDIEAITDCLKKCECIKSD